MTGVSKRKKKVNEKKEKEKYNERTSRTSIEKLNYNCKYLALSVLRSG